MTCLFLLTKASTDSIKWCSNPFWLHLQLNRELTYETPELADSTGPSRCKGALVERSVSALTSTARANDLHLDLEADDLAFQLVFSYPRGGETLVFKTSSARDCDNWIKAISSASRRARDIRVRASRKTR